MVKLNNSGAADLLIPLVLASTLLIFSIGFGVWAFMSRQDYKNNVDEKIATAVEVTKQQVESDKDNEFVEREKEPLRKYSGPATYGSIKFNYPKTWSVYSEESTRSSTPLSLYLHPGIVPGVDSEASFGARLEVSDDTYENTVKGFDSKVRDGKISVKAYSPDKVSGIVGLHLQGEIATKKHGIMIILPLRDKTIKLWNESEQQANDFVKHILSSFSFTP